MPEENQTAQTPSAQPQPKKGGSNLAIILIIVFAALIILGVGGYFGWKYVASKYLKKAATTASTKELSLKTLEALYSYPGGTITQTDRSKNSGAASEITYETTDKLKTVYDYYLSLATKNNLTVSRKSLETDQSAGSMTIQGSGYYVDISLFQYEKTDIYVSIFGDNIKNDTSNADATSTTGTSNTTGSSSKTTISTEYVISDSDSRVISKSELTSFTPWELKVARNEIYARHGREFVHKDLQCYFTSKSWYSIDPNFSESMLSVTENKNVATIQAYEQETNSPLQNKDSGC